MWVAITIIIHYYEYNYMCDRTAMKTMKMTRETIDNIESTVEM